MATAISHAVAALAIAACFYSREVPKRVWALGAVYAALPDLDVIGFAFGIPYDSVWGHRGISHAIAFAFALATLTVALRYRRGVPGLSALGLGAFLFLATISHGLLDALTDGGLGVAFFAPFDNGRYFFPVTPIKVSPIGLRPFFTARGLSVMRNEMVWIWAPSVAVAGLALALRRSCLPGQRPGA